MKKVLFVNLRLSTGGSERVMTLLANSIADAGIETEMIILSKDKEVYDLSSKVKKIECFCPRKNSKLIWHIKRIISLRKQIKKSNPDTIISFMWDINMNVILASLGLRKRIIISERADPNNEARIRSLHFAVNWVFPFANLIVFQTNEAMNCYPQKLKKKSIVIPNPVRTDFPKVKLGMNDKIIIAAGRCTEQKNFKMLLDAFNLFYKSHRDYKLYLLGDGPDRERLEKYSKSLQCSNSVFFLGFTADIFSVMQRASIYASSSNYEGISNAMMEALSIGLPAVCTDCPVGGAAMVIKSGYNGILVPVSDFVSMAKAFSKIADDKFFSDQLSENAFNSVKDYSLENIANKWISLL